MRRRSIAALAATALLFLTLPRAPIDARGVDAKIQ